MLHPTRALPLAPTRLPAAGAIPGWLAYAARVGIACSVFVPLGIVAGQAVPALLQAYPLVLLPLLLAGPLAARDLPLRTALPAAAIAGLVSALVASLSLAAGSQIVGVYNWTLVSPAAAPPMPVLPHLLLLPAGLMTWAQQDVLLLQVPLAILLAALTELARLLLDWSAPLTARILPASLTGRLTLTLASLMALTIAVGWTGFGALEDMHLRGHRLQLQAEWQDDLSDVREALDNEQIAAARGEPTADFADTVDAGLRELGSGQPYPDISLGQSDFQATAAHYQPLIDRTLAAHAAFRADPTDTSRGAAVASALDDLRAQVDQDTHDLLNTDDLDHHERLIVVMLVLAFACGAGLWLGQRLVETVNDPIQRLGAHLLRVSRGDFSRQVRVTGPRELSRLATQINHMTSELDRLYQAERAGRAAAEATAERERQAASAKEFWTNTVVHDLKSPLTVISGYMDLLDAQLLGPLTGKQLGAVADARRAATALQGLIADINDSFRLEVGEWQLDARPVAPGELLRQAAQDVARPGRTPLAVDCACDLPPVAADARLVSRVLQNLASNAFKHAGEAARVRLAATLTDDATVRFVVEDDGPGIPAEQRERIFQRFAQGDGGTPGSGLGLAFCQLVVQRHGGRIWAEAADPHGARLCFQLPVASRQVADGAAEPERVSEPLPA